MKAVARYLVERKNYMALSEEDVLPALRDCYDPEIPVNIVDLGLIYKVMLTPDRKLQAGVSQAARGSGDNDDLAGLPVPRHDHGAGA